MKVMVFFVLSPPGVGEEAVAGRAEAARARHVLTQGSGRSGS